MRAWVPPRVARELRDGSREHAAEIDRASRIDDTCKWLNRELRQIDRYLEMRFFHPDGPMPVGAVPGRYHLTYRPPVGPATLISITGPGGSFLEPNSGIFNMLRKGDLWNNEARHDRRRREEAAERAATRAKAREDEERREELKDRYNAAFRTSVSMLPGWSQNAAGRRGRTLAR